MTIETALELIRSLNEAIVMEVITTHEESSGTRTRIMEIEDEIIKAYNRMKDRIAELEQLQKEDREVILALSKVALKPGTFEDLIEKDE